MKKAMISQPMKSVHTEAEILETKKRAEETLKSMGYEVVNTYFDDEWANPENMKKREFQNLTSRSLSWQRVLRKWPNARPFISVRVGTRLVAA